VGSTTGRLYKRYGNWYVDVDLGGRRIRRVAGSYKADAKALLEEILANHRPGSGFVPLADVLEDYIRTLRVTAKASSREKAETRGRTLLRHFGEPKDANAITAKDVEHFAASRLKTGVSRVTVNGDLKILRAALRHAYHRDELTRVPRINLLREPRRLPAILTPAQVRKLLTVAPAPYDLMIHLAAGAGLRLGEARHLQARDLGSVSRVLKVSAKPEVDWLPKSHAERAVPMSRPLAERLEPTMAYLAPDSWLFPGVRTRDDGTRGPITEQTALNHLRAVWRSLGFVVPGELDGERPSLVRRRGSTRLQASPRPVRLLRPPPARHTFVQPLPDPHRDR